MRPLFSVIVPTYRRPELLSYALESVRAQSLPDFECLVVSDAPDHLPDRFPHHDSRFHLLSHSVNKGAAAARNTGVRAARGTYVAFLDDDDLYAPERLALSLPLLQTSDVAVCARRTLDGRRVRSPRLQGNVSGVILNGFTPHLGQTTVRRDACPAFNESYAALEDVEWWLRVGQALDVSSTLAIGYLMRRHDGVRHGNGVEARIACSRRILQDYHTYFASRLEARAFRLERIALLEATSGHRGQASSAAWEALRTRPRPRSLALALRIGGTPWGRNKSSPEHRSG